MISKNFFFFIICFVSSSCKTSNMLMSTLQDDLPSIYKKVVHVLKLCFQDNLNPLITTFEIREQINPFFSELQSASIMLINDNLELNNSKNMNNNMPILLLESYSKEYLEDMLIVLKSSPWWDIKAPFILIGASNNSCVDAVDILNEIWKKKILSAIFFCCYNNSNEVMMFTFNPFTHYAPDPWKMVANEGENNLWTLYYQHFNDSRNICKNLMFDKTRYLNGYPIKVVTNKPVDMSQAAVSQPYNMNILLKRTPLPYRAIIPTVFKTSNITLLIYDGELGWMDHGKMSGCLVNVSKSEYDIYLQQRPLYVEYPHKTIFMFVTELALLSTKTPFLTTEEKLLSFCEPNVFILIFFVGLITILVLKLTKKQDLSSALLNILRIFLYTSILQPLKICSIRIYFFGVFWLIVIINGTFQGKLATFLTKPDRHLIETLDDVIKHQLHLHLSVRVVDRFEHKLSVANSKRIHPHVPAYCNNSAVNDNQSVCIGEGSAMVKLSENKHHLYVSSPIDQISIVWLTSPDFSLVGKINAQLFRCIESGLIKLWYDQGYPNHRKKMLAVEAAETKAQYRPIQLHDILFAFKLLIIGIALSSILFIMEVNSR